MSPDAGPEAWAPALAAALSLAYADREAAPDDDPAVAVAWITSDSLARRRALDLGRGAPPPDDAGEPDHTTHVTVVDRDGFVVSLTQSLGPAFGAMVVPPSLGFPYASTMGGYLSEGGPGTRAWSSQSPLIVMRAGVPVLALGGGGGRRIISAAVGTVAHFGTGVGLREALSAPRLHPSGSTVYVDGRWPPEVVPALEAAGWTVEVRERSWFARLNAVARADTTWVGVADPSWSGGAASGPRPASAGGGAARR